MRVEELRGLLNTGEARDRAFVDGVIRLQPELANLHKEVISAADRAHSDLRTRIREGELRGDALRKIFDDIPALERDHFVEEVLGIAYPPLEERALAPEEIAYMPSGYDEIVYAFDATKLSAKDHFLDVGSGAGKVVMLAALLTNTIACEGIECDRALVDIANRAAGALNIGRHRALFKTGDARDSEFASDNQQQRVVFMYLPFTGKTLTNVVKRLEGANARFLCAQALDLAHFDFLTTTGVEPKSWLNVYAFTR